MTIDKEKLNALVERVKTHRRFCADEYHHALADGVQALFADIERLTKFEDWFVRLDQVEQSLAASYKAERDQLKAENEALRKALGDLLALYEDDEGCRELPEYIAGRAAMAKEAVHD